MGDQPEIIDWGDNDGMTVQSRVLNDRVGDFDLNLPRNANIKSSVCGDQTHIRKLTIRGGSTISTHSFGFGEVDELSIDLDVLRESCDRDKIPQFFKTLKKLVINGTGACKFSNIHLFRDLRVVVVSNGITSISEGQFRDQTRLQEVELPTTLVSIEPFAFCHCTALSTCILPMGVKEIGKAAFANCIQLWISELPSKLKTLGEHAFYHCASISKLKIPPGVAVTGHPFERCNVSSVTVPRNEARFYMDQFPPTKEVVPRLYRPADSELILKKVPELMRSFGLRSVKKPEYQTFGKYNLTAQQTDTIKTLLLAFNRTVTLCSSDVMDKILANFEERSNERFGRSHWKISQETQSGNGGMMDFSTNGFYEHSNPDYDIQILPHHYDIDEEFADYKYQRALNRRREADRRMVARNQPPVFEYEDENVQDADAPLNQEARHRRRGDLM